VSERVHVVCKYMYCLMVSDFCECWKFSLQFIVLLKLTF